MSESAAPGWYADTSASAPTGRVRYWDGSTWTDQTHDQPAGGVAHAIAIGALRAPRPAETSANVALPLWPTVGAIAGGAFVVGLLQGASNDKLMSWMTRVALPIALFVVVAAAVRKVRRWDLVARDGGIAVAAATVGSMIIGAVVPPSWGPSVAELSGPRFGQFNASAWWYRQTLAVMLISALVGGCAIAAVFWADGKRLPLAAGGGAAAGAALTVLLAPLPLFESSTVIPTMLWLTLTMFAALLLGDTVTRETFAPNHYATQAEAAFGGSTGSTGAQSAWSPSGGLPAYGTSYELASMGSRFWARVLDGLILLLIEIVLFAVFVAVVASGSAGAAVGVVFLIAIAAIGILWEPMFLIKRGATPGKKAMGICVARADNGGPIGAGKAWGRFLLPATWGWIPILGFIITLIAFFTALGDPKKRTWMDKAAGTLVVRATPSLTAQYASSGAVSTAGMRSASPPARFPAAAPQPTAPSNSAFTAPVASQPFVPVMPVFDAPFQPAAPQSTSAPSVPAIPQYGASVAAPLIEQVPGIVSTPAAPVLGTVVPTPAAAPPRMFDDDAFDANATIHSANLAQLRQRRGYSFEFSTGQRASLVSGRLIVGREPQVVVAHDESQVIAVTDPDRSISRTHLIFAIHEGRLTVEDAHSANGSAVITADGAQTPLAPGVPVAIESGSRVLFGRCEAHVRSL